MNIVSSMSNSTEEVRIETENLSVDDVPHVGIVEPQLKSEWEGVSLTQYYRKHY